MVINADTLDQAVNLAIHIPAYLQARGIQSQNGLQEHPRIIRQFLQWVDLKDLKLNQLSPADVERFGSTRKGKSHRSASREINVITNFIAWLCGFNHPAIAARAFPSDPRPVLKPADISKDFNSDDPDLDDQLTAADIERYLVLNFTNQTTRNTYRSYLKAFSLWIRKNKICIDQVKARDVVDFIKDQKWCNHVKSTACQCIARFYAIQYGQDHAAAQAKKKRPKFRPQPFLTMNQVLQVYQHLSENSPINIRNRAIFGLMLNAGFLEKEIAEMHLVDVNLKKMVVVIRRDRKNENEQTFEGMISAQTKSDLVAWMNIRQKYVLEEVETLFVSMNGLRMGNPLNKVTIRGIFMRMDQALGFHFSPQDVRRSFIILSAEAGASIETIRRTGGWVSDFYIKKVSEQFVKAKVTPITPRAILEANAEKRNH